MTTTGCTKVIITGASSDPPNGSPTQATNPESFLVKRMKNPDDGLKIAIVRDMAYWFDVPSLHTMYIDKPMKGHTLMQAIARVNRYSGITGGLIVDYIGIADPLKTLLHAIPARTGDRRD